MSEMVERVARAICYMHGGKICGPGQHIASREIGWDPGHQYMQTYVDRHWKEHDFAARAAIEAMREPTAQMVMVGDNEMDEWDPAYEVCPLVTTWQAMIDEALK